MKPPFTLKSGHWYAMEVWDENWPRLPMPSPIKVYRVTPLKQGNGMLRVKFFHANYPAGVQDKEYELRVLHRSACALAAVSADSGEDRVLVFFPLTLEWLRTHWPDLVREKCEQPIEQIMARLFPKV
ncbi:MAG: hypothetical protein PCFJNLEI_03224 [Verrucomicrobiae bacterium]|nr:hypothetical protein [Verrucomicrobiae bacterium]